MPMRHPCQATIFLRPRSGIAGWRGGRIAGVGSECTRPALLPAGLVPERWNVKGVFIETSNGQRLTGRVCWHLYFLMLSKIAAQEALE